MARVDLEVVAAVNDAVNGIRSVEQALARQGASVGQLQQVQNQLTKAQLDADHAAAKLADAYARLASATDPDEQAALKREVAGAQVAMDKQGQEVLELTAHLDKLKTGTQANVVQQRSLITSMTDIKSAIDLTVGTLRTIQRAGEQAFEFGKQGAQITQTTESFAGLMENVGVTGNLLAELRAASSGTISDMKLMSATTTLLAGAQGELATSLANATPELLEIAKAANKLNPSLGDTTFLYESLALGVKRASPMILDNLGLTIKIGEANKTYAALLGKTVEQLTAEEQKQALLNETLRAGKVLIDQAGGAAGSATDEYARFEAQTENLINQLKMLAGPVVGDFADAWGTKIELINTANEAFKAGQINAAEYAAILARQVTPAGIDATDELAALNKVLDEQAEAADAANQALYNAANEGASDFHQRIEDVIPALLSQEERTNELRVATTQATDAITYATINELKLKAAADDAAAAQAALAGRFNDLSMAIEGPVSDANEGYYQEQRDAGQVIADLKIELEKLKTAHGQVVTSTEDGTTAARNLIIAQDAAATAAENLKTAQEKLAEDPGDLGLMAAVARAEIAVATSQTNVETWGAKIGEVNAQYVIDNSTAIAEVELKLGEANAAYDTNATEHEKATARIVFGMLQQNLAMDGFTAEEIGFLTDVGEEWGIYDTKTANALRAVDAAIAKHGLDANAVIADLHDNIRNLPESKVINIEVRTNYTQYGAEPGPGVPPIAPPGPPDDPNNANDGAF